MKAKLNFLKLVYPPISNQEAEWLQKDSDVIAKLEESNLYMIVQRHESKFNLLDTAEMKENLDKNLSIKFKYTVDNMSDDVEINLRVLFENHGINIDDDDYDYDFELDEKLIRIWKCDLDTNERLDLVDWFTTEKILWDKWRGNTAISGLDKYKQFTNYYLHYVGISNKDNSFKRLVIKPHDKRLRILSNENSMSNKARLTDEIILLFFKVEPLDIQTLEEKENINDFIGGIKIDNKKIIADAEKAFIHILDSNYNIVKFINYPKGADGLYNEDLTRYGYILAEPISLRTDKEEIIGDIASEYKFPESADVIMIQDDNVVFIKN